MLKNLLYAPFVLFPFMSLRTGDQLTLARDSADISIDSLFIFHCICDCDFVVLGAVLLIHIITGKWSDRSCLQQRAKKTTKMCCKL